MNTQTKRKLDKDWVTLMKEAKNLGLHIEDVKKFLRTQSKKKDTDRQLKQQTFRKTLIIYKTGGSVES